MLGLNWIHVSKRAYKPHFCEICVFKLTKTNLKMSKIYKFSDYIRKAVPVDISLYGMVPYAGFSW